MKHYLNPLDELPEDFSITPKQDDQNYFNHEEPSDEEIYKRLWMEEQKKKFDFLDPELEEEFY